MDTGEAASGYTYYTYNKKNGPNNNINKTSQLLRFVEIHSMESLPLSIRVHITQEESVLVKVFQQNTTNFL